MYLQKYVLLTYSCLGKNHLKNKTKTSEVGHLNVEMVNTGSFKSYIQPMAFISPTPLSMKYVAEGDNVIFECAATGIPSPRLKWSFKTSIGKLKLKIIIINYYLTNFNYCIGNKQDTLLSDEETSVNILSLTGVSRRDSGTYTCYAFQSVPEYQHIQIAQVTV